MRKEKTEKAYPCIVPPEDDPYVGYKIFELLDEVLADKDNIGLPAKWRRSYELIKNRHWKTTSRNASFVTGNLLHSNRLKTVNLLTDNHPTFDVVPSGPASEANADKCQTIHRTASFWWQDTEQQSILEMSVSRGETNGCAIEKIIFNPELESGLGDVEVLSVDPFTFGLYPVDTFDLQKADALLYYTAMPAYKAKTIWPDKADSIKPDTEYLDELGSDRREVSGMRNTGEPRGYVATFSGVIKKVANTLSAVGLGEDDSDQVLVVECWVKDRSQVTKTKNVTHTDDLGNDNDKVREDYEDAKYPGFIRAITVCCGGSVVLSDKPNPSINPALSDEQARISFLYDRFPFCRVASITDPENGWGMGDLEQLEGLQMQLDKSLSQFTTYKDKIARPKIINPQNSGVNNKAFSNASGIINPMSEIVSRAIRYMEHPPAPAELYQSVSLFSGLFKEVAGTFDLEQADQTGSLAYKSIAALLENAHTMRKGKVRNYEKLIRFRGRAYVSMMQNFYTEDRYIPATDMDGQSVVDVVRGEQMLIPFRFTVVSGSTMPISKVQKREEALELFRTGAVDQLELLRSLDWPNYRSVVQRMKAGPIGVFLDKLVAIGVPPPIVQVLSKIAKMDDKEFKQSFERGDIPLFNQMISGQQPDSGQPDSGQLEQQQKQIELQLRAQESQAAIAKIQAEVELIREKLNTEQVLQQVKAAGVQLDLDNMDLNRAKVVAAMRQHRDKTDIDIAKLSHQDDGGYNERGMRSNNIEDEHG